MVRLLWSVKFFLANSCSHTFDCRLFICCSCWGCCRLVFWCANVALRTSFTVILLTRRACGSNRGQMSPANSSVSTRAVPNSDFCHLTNCQVAQWSFEWVYSLFLHGSSKQGRSQKFCSGVWFSPFSLSSFPFHLPFSPQINCCTQNCHINFKNSQHFRGGGTC